MFPRPVEQPKNSLKTSDPGESQPHSFDQPELEAAVASATSLLLFLDFDGTLSPIVAHPDLAQLPSLTRSILEQLTVLRDVFVCVISGRSLADIKARVGIPTLIYAGDHGLEIEGRGLRFEHLAATRMREALQSLTEKLASRLSPIPGIGVEAKLLTTALHYRQADEWGRAQAESVVNALVPHDDPNFVVREGKKVIEIQPRVAWNKGMAVRWLQERLGAQDALTFVIGDDRTDEDAFRALEDAITIRVEPNGPTAARFVLANPDEVRQRLGWLLDAWRSHGDRPMPAR